MFLVVETFVVVLPYTGEPPVLILDKVAVVPEQIIVNTVSDL